MTKVSPKGQISKNGTKGQKYRVNTFLQPNFELQNAPFFRLIIKITKNCKDKCT